MSILRNSLRFAFVGLLSTTGCDDDDGDAADAGSAATATDDGSTSSDPTTDSATPTGDTTPTDDSTGPAEPMVDEAAVLEAALAYSDLEQVSVEPRSSQHALADTVQFYVGAEYRDLYLTVDPENPTEVTFPEGTLLVKENLDEAGDPDGFFAMYKAFEGYDPEGNDWYWLRVDGAGATGNSGQVGFCKDCHGGGTAAVSDFVFGVPTDNRP